VLAGGGSTGVDREKEEKKSRQKLFWGKGTEKLEYFLDELNG
jgi:hypothetical protein